MTETLNNPSIDREGNKHWHNEEGQLHREGGPASEWVDGRKEWRHNGVLHRLDGPAREYADGTKEWWLNGNPHRLDGPAFDIPGVRMEFWKEGRRIMTIDSEAELDEIINMLIKTKKGMKNG